MLSILDYTLKSSFEGVLLIAVLFLYLTILKLPDKLNWLKSGVILALGWAVILVYGIDFWGDRELFEFIWLAATLPAVSMLAITGYLSRQIKLLQKVIGPLVLLNAVLLITVSGIEFVAFPSKIFVQARSFLSTELILKVIGAFAGMLLAAIFGWSYIKATQKISKKSVVLTALVVMLIILSRHFITLLQLGMTLGYIPVTPVLVSIVAPVINIYYPLFFYSLVLVVALQMVLARMGAKMPDLGGLANPALKRKTLAGYRNHVRWLAITGVFILTTGALLGVGYVQGNQKIKLSPAVPVQAVNGVIRVPVSQVNDNKLHRFSYQTKDNIPMRFIVIDKGNGLFGVGLDACDICGQVGYYQRGDEVVCMNCDVVINKVTIGFPGGCNPIPFPNKAENGNISINTLDLEQKQNVFAE
ncbi:Fe-S-containing protein [Paradesulfitobacterium aromaticivorans]